MKNQRKKSRKKEMRLLDISYVVISEKGGGSCTAAQNK